MSRFQNSQSDNLSNQLILARTSGDWRWTSSRDFFSLHSQPITGWISNGKIKPALYLWITQRREWCLLLLAKDGTTSQQSGYPCFSCLRSEPTKELANESGREEKFPSSNSWIGPVTSNEGSSVLSAVKTGHLVSPGVQTLDSWSNFRSHGNSLWHWQIPRIATILRFNYN